MSILEIYVEELVRWLRAGRPVRTQERMQEIHGICQKCPHFQPNGGWLPGYDRCGECGCNLHPTQKNVNKIAWATTQCPLKDPLWGPDVDSGLK